MDVAVNGAHNKVIGRAEEVALLSGTTSRRSRGAHGGVSEAEDGEDDDWQERG